MKCLMVAFAFVLPYHVLRTAAAAGHTVHVLGNGPSRGLRWSRQCASYRSSRCYRPGEDTGIFLEEIREVVRRRGIDVILPSDDVSTRLLGRLQNELPVPTSLLPDVPTFDLLNDKWNFTRFCLDHGVRVPKGWLYEDVADLRAALDSGRVELPLTLKPLSCSGGTGVIHVREPGELAALAEIDYRPVLAQRYIHGETIGISIAARDGEILTHATQRRDDRRFELFPNPDLLRNVERLAAATRLTGPANFDAVLEEGTGDSYIVECNPRFWYTIYMPMLLGLNFVDAAITGRAATPLLSGKLCLALGEIMHRRMQASTLDRAMLRYHFGDPAPYYFQRRHLFDDRDINVRPEEMASYVPHAVEAPAPVTECRGFRGLASTRASELGKALHRYASPPVLPL